MYGVTANGNNAEDNIVVTAPVRKVDQPKKDPPKPKRGMRL